MFPASSSHPLWLLTSCYILTFDLPHLSVVIGLWEAAEHYTAACSPPLHPQQDKAENQKGKGGNSGADIKTVKQVKQRPHAQAKPNIESYYFPWADKCSP